MTCPLMTNNVQLSSFFSTWVLLESSLLCFSNELWGQLGDLSRLFVEYTVTMTYGYWYTSVNQYPHLAISGSCTDEAAVSAILDRRMARADKAEACDLS